jgi:hypothetical protein
VIHIIRSYNACGHPVLTALLECDGCGATSDNPICTTSPEGLFFDRARLRIWAREKNQWASHTLLWPGNIGGPPCSFRVDLCPKCRKQGLGKVRKRPWK